MYASLNHDNIAQQIADFVPRIVSNWITLCLYAPIYNLLQINLIWENLKLFLLRHSKVHYNIPQKELNKIYEAPSFGYQGAYVSKINTLCYTLFYSMLFPSGIIITILGYALIFIEERIQILKISKSEYNKKRDNLTNIIRLSQLYVWIPFLLVDALHRLALWVQHLLSFLLKGI